jgi:2-isopropylmalate synthase
MTTREDSIVAANVLTREYDDAITGDIDLDDNSLHEDTLHDGEQTVGMRFTLEQQVSIARMLLDAGVKHLCVGFPAVSEDARHATRAVLGLGYEDRILYALARPLTSDIDAVLATGAPAVATFIPTSDLRLEYELRMDEQTAIERTAAVVSYAVNKGLYVGVRIEDGSRTPFDRIVRVCRAMVEAGANTMTIMDTVGIFTPISTYRFIKALNAAVPGMNLGVHFHNDLGMAVANSISAAQAGVRRIGGAFAGLGGRAGATCLEEVATILRVKYGCNRSIDLTRLVTAAQRICEIAQLRVAPCKPILGSKVYSHESGIHVHGITSEPATYEAFPPALIGREHEIHFGKHSGMHSIRYLANKYEIEASDAAMEETLRRIKALTDERGCPSPDEAASILRSIVAGG